jgi:hypothetical protein
MKPQPAPVREWHDVDAVKFRDVIAKSYEPAVLRGVVAHWPAVAQARVSMESASRYLDRFASGAKVHIIVMPPHVRGRMFYNDDMSGFNFSRSTASIREVSDRLLRNARFERRPALAAQHALISECLPGFAQENVLSLLDASIEPRIWLGSAMTTPAHFDESNNVACVMAGRRRFTLFPPEQTPNLYVGPLGHAPTGTPISLVTVAEPDFARFPRFREALAHARVAELEAGDAIYIPMLWWHHVESLDKYNALINYWWKGRVGADARADSALGCLLHCLLALRHLPPEHRQVWKRLFEYYVFDADEATFAHIPEHVRGILGDIPPDVARSLKAFLVQQLQR